MYVERAIYPITTLGPGNRLVVWFKGCSKHCAGCANPELWEVLPSRDKSFSATAYAGYLLSVNEEFGAHRLTLTGGDPLEQPGEIALLLELVRGVYDDILVYTGFTLEEAKRIIPPETLNRITSNTDVLIDGPYIDNLNDNAIPLRGSTNQQVYYFNTALRDEYEAYMAKGRTVTNIVRDGNVISVGIHNRGDYFKEPKGANCGI